VVSSDDPFAEENSPGSKPNAPYNLGRAPAAAAVGSAASISAAAAARSAGAAPADRYNHETLLLLPRTSSHGVDSAYDDADSAHGMDRASYDSEYGGAGPSSSGGRGGVGVPREPPLSLSLKTVSDGALGDDDDVSLIITYVYHV